MLKILEKRNLVGLPDGSVVDGLVYVKNYSVLPTKSGGSYIGGSLESKGTIPFKSWSNTEAYKVLTESDPKVQGPKRVVASVNIYGGTFSLVVQNVFDVSGEHKYTFADFSESKYDIEGYWDNLCATLKKLVSPEAYNVFTMIMSEGVADRFKEEVAAVSHHDNCFGGLLGHSLKVSKMCSLLKMYPNLYSRVDTDLLYVGCAVHDIGKILEYNQSCMSEYGKMVSHLCSGAILVSKYEKEIIGLKGESFYWGLLSVISQHHGEYGERPRTVASYVIHMLDLLESQLTSLDQMLEDSSQNQLVVGDFKLSV